MCDNQSSVKLSTNPVFHDRSKHIEIKYHYLRDMVQRKLIELKYVSTEEQVVDILTKPLPRMKFNCFRKKLGLMENDILKLEIISTASQIVILLLGFKCVGFMSYLSIDELKGLSNEWFIRHNIC